MCLELRGAAGREEAVLAVPVEMMKRSAAGDGCCAGVG